MSYDILKNPDGEILVMPLELPMYDGTAEDLGRQAMVGLCSFLRHAAIVDYYTDEGSLDDDILQYGEVSESFEQHLTIAATQLASTMMTLASLADKYQIDIMQEVMEGIE